MTDQNNHHIIIISQHYPPDKSGNASRIRDMSNRLTKMGWDVTVLAPPPAFPHGEFDRSWRRKSSYTDNEVTIHRLWSWQPSKGDPGFISRMLYYVLFPIHAMFWLMIHFRSYDIVLTSSPPIFTGLAVFPITLINRKPWVVDIRDLWIDASISLGFIGENSFSVKLSKLFQKQTLQLSDHVTVTTATISKRLAKDYQIETEKITLIPNGVDMRTFQSNGHESEPTIIYTGNVGHAQDLATCINAIALLETSNLQLQIVGNGDILDDLQDLAKEKNITNQVKFIDVQPRHKIPELLNKSLIGVAPLKNEGALEYAIPTKVYEYMACGLPIVATGSGEIEDILQESGAGMVVENSPDALANAFLQIYQNTDLQTEMGERGQQFVYEKYDRKKITERLNHLLLSLVES